jgi:hypothetical protein
MVDGTGVGSERASQAFFRRSSGSWATDGITAGMRVGAEGFASALDADVFTVRATTAATAAVEDPFGRLVTEAGTGDETLTALKVPVAYEVITNQDATQELQVMVTVPLRPGTKSIVPVDEIRSQYRLRDRVSGVVASGWVPIEPVSAGAASVTFGPIPASSDWDFAAQSISKEKTASDWMCVTGDGPSDRPGAPDSLQVHGDAVATAEGSEFALRVEWSAPNADDVFSFLVRTKRAGDGSWVSQRVYDKTSALVVPAQVGDYTVEVYTIAASGQPSDVLTGTFAFEPDRDFELTSVSALRLMNPGAAIDEFSGPDVLLACVEPEYSAESGADDPADVNAGIDPLVRYFEWQVFDPATGTVLRTDLLYSREYRYTRSMNADDQSLVFTRGPHRSLGFRVRLHSTTNRTSAADVLVVENPRPAAPPVLSLTSSPGNSVQGLDAIVHATVTPGAAKSDSDFRAFGVWASTSPGFTPSPSNFKGLAAAGDNRLSFPAPSGVAVYVVCGGLDYFHADPELIASPATDVSLLPEQSVTTIDGAVFPVDTNDIVPRAVTDMLSANGAVGSSGNPIAQAPLWSSGVAINANASNGPIVANGGTVFRRGSQEFDGTDCRLLRQAKLSAVYLFDASAGTYTDVTDDAWSSSSPHVTPLGDSGDFLYLGSKVRFGYATANTSNTVLHPSADTLGPHLRVQLATSTTGGDPLVLEYWNGSAWTVPGVFSDFSSGFTGTAGSEFALRWSQNVDWTQNAVNGATLYWVRIRFTSTPSAIGALSRVFLQQTLDTTGSMDAGDAQRVMTGLVAGSIASSEDLETFIVQGQRGESEGGTGSWIQNATLTVTVGKR